MDPPDTSRIYLTVYSIEDQVKYANTSKTPCQTYNFILNSIQTKNDEIKRLTDELYRLRDGSMSDYQSCMQENSELKRQTAQLQLEFDLVSESSQVGLYCLEILS